MNGYNFAADFLNKYSQLTPWVQMVIGLGACAVMLGVAYFIKETVAVIVRPFQYNAATKEEKQQWRDKYYRDETAG